ncbi:MAG: M20 metallopeptidase family protein [Spirochaetota bacterium]
MKNHVEGLSEHIYDVLPEVTQLRRMLHSRPEMAGEETGTRAMLMQYAQGFWRQFWNPLLGTDLVFEIPGRDTGRVLGLRADMDGLPIDEQSPLSYASQNTGTMHACGHDGHMAMLMGAAQVLARMKDRLPCTVRFIFQPGEEVACLGSELVKRGVCDGLEAVYALHNWPGLPAGTISTKAGILFAAANTFSLKVLGTGTHGATPEKGNNPLISAAALAGEMQQLHNEVSQSGAGVVSVCSMHGGSGTNVIPSECTVSGTTRYVEVADGDMIEQRIRKLSREISQRFDVSVNVDYERKYYLPLFNHPEHVRRVEAVAQSVLGDGAFSRAPSHTMTAEDFSFYLDTVPGCMFWLGTGEGAQALHSGNYNFNDEVLSNGIAMFAGLALSADVP